MKSATFADRAIDMGRQARIATYIRGDSWEAYYVGYPKIVGVGYTEAAAVVDLGTKHANFIRERYPTRDAAYHRSLDPTIN